MQWQQIFDIETQSDFNAMALQVFHYQATHNAVYADYLRLLQIDVAAIDTVDKIPYLPIELFKTHQVVVDGLTATTIFESSGTTGQQPSRHYVTNTAIYEQSYSLGFQRAFGAVQGMCILALLPSYLERGQSSLVYMVNGLIQQSKHPQSGFFLHNLGELAIILKQQAAANTPTLLIGVTYALLDLAEQYPMPLGNIKIMETGGMKGRREEITREELHLALKNAFGVPAVYSEYGMTELLSQAYTDGNEWFSPPPWMRITTRDPYDPLSTLPSGSKGGINIIDLANINSCAFIATSDLGQVLPDGRFTVLGRMDQAEMRGCNLMVE